MQFQRKIPAMLQAVSELTQTAEEWLTENGLEGEASSLALVIQELCVNIVEHGYAGEHGDIAFTITTNDSIVQFDIQDWAQNRFVAPDEITLPDPLDLPEGGWGLYLIYQIMDTVTYQASKNGNRWQLIKHR